MTSTIRTHRWAAVEADLACRLAEAIWHMLSTNQPFAPAGAAQSLAS